ncbi:MAG: zinc ribbon domain-containing protein [Gammaproteobacteria bacterium]
MPIYEYVCSQCNHHLEALQKLSDDPLVFCPECGEATLRKQVSAAAFRLKGTGWYETDFKNSGKDKKGEGASGKSESSSSVAPADSGSTKADSGLTKDNSSTAKGTSDKASNTSTSSSASKPA